MKKILFLLAMLPMFVFTACSSDNEAEEIIKYSSIKIQVEGRDSYYEDDQAIRQSALIEIYEGSRIEKKDINKVGIAYDTESNVEVKAVVTQDDKWSYVFDKAKIGKSYFIFVKTKKYPSLDFNEGAYSYKSVIAPLNENEEIEVNKVFTFNARPNQYEEWNSDITLNTSDYYVARYGDSREVINMREKYSPFYVTSSYDKYIVNDYTNKYYYYFNDIFYKGITKTSHQYSAQYPQLLVTCMADFRKEVTKLKEMYGEPFFYTVDIYSFNNSSSDYTKQDDFIISQEIMNGFKVFEYHFKSDRSIIKCKVSGLDDGRQTQPWAYTVATSYEANEE